MDTVINIPEDQVEELEAYCEQAKISQAEAIRRAIALLVSQRERDERAIRASAGIWKGLGIDTDTYLAELRSEWDR